MLRFKIDENLPIDVARLLADAGYDACTVLDQQLGGHDDCEVADVCRDENRALVTLDLDFADIRAYPPRDYAGIIVLRLARPDKGHLLNAVKRLLPLLERESLLKQLWIVGETTVRIRG